MLNQFRTWTLIAGMACIAVTAQADDSEGVVRLGGGDRSATGVVRISDQTEPTVIRGQSPQSGEVIYDSSYEDGGYCPQCYGGGGVLSSYFGMQAAQYRMRNRSASAQIAMAARSNAQQSAQIARCKFGYFIPTGCGGAGCPPFGVYRMVYPADPSYFDQRDGQVYAAAGYGGPVAVPIAPNVEHTYNYGWGLPSSRLTPISHPTP